MKLGAAAIFLSVLNWVLLGLGFMDLYSQKFLKDINK